LVHKSWDKEQSNILAISRKSKKEIALLLRKKNKVNLAQKELRIRRGT
jgi:hypothetical protein